MSELSQNPSVDIIKAIASFLLTIATTTASFAIIATLVGAAGGKSVVNIQGNEVAISSVFLFWSLTVSLSLLGFSCYVLNLLKKV